MMKRYVTIPAGSPSPTTSPPSSRKASPSPVGYRPLRKPAAPPNPKAMPCKTRFSGMEVTINNNEPGSGKVESFLSPSCNKFLKYVPNHEEDIGAFKNLTARRQYKYIRYLLSLAEEAELLRNPPRGKELAAAAYEEETEELKQQLETRDENKMEKERERVGDMLMSTARLHGYLLMGSGSILAVVLLLLLLLLAFQTRG